MRQWPADETEVVQFEEITEPLVEALRFVYDLRRINVDRDVPYDGFVQGAMTRATNPDPDVVLSAERLREVEESQGWDPATRIIGLAVQMGIEQGQRLLRKEGYYHRDQITAAIFQVMEDLAYDDSETSAIESDVRHKLIQGLTADEVHEIIERHTDRVLAKVPDERKQALLQGLKALIDDENSRQG